MKANRVLKQLRTHGMLLTGLALGGAGSARAQTDILWHHSTSTINEMWALAGTAQTGTVGGGPIGPIPSNNGVTGWKMAGTADFNNDGHRDILWYNRDTGQIAYWYMNGSSYVSSAIVNTLQTDPNWEVIGAGYFGGPGDTKADILWRHNVSTQVAVWYMDNSTYIQGCIIYSWGTPATPGGAWKASAGADYEPNGQTDIILRNYATGDNVVWMLDRTNIVNSAWLQAESDVNYELAGADRFNPDTNLDLLWRHRTHPLTGIWVMTGAQRQSTVWLSDREVGWRVGGTGKFGPFYTVGVFSGLKMQGESGTNIPDTMGAVGPNHFLVILNGDRSVAAYNKTTGQRLSHPETPSSEFFGVTVSSGPYTGSYPTISAVDPRVIYDQDPISQKWIACALDAGSKHVLLAISKTHDPVGIGGPTWVSANWRKYLVPIDSVCDNDYPSLAVDKNGIYITIVRFGCQGDRVIAIPKAPLVGGSAANQPVVQEGFQDDIVGGFHQVRPAVNFDPIGANDDFWLIHADFEGKLGYNRLKWLNGFTSKPVFQLNPWGELTVTRPYRSELHNIPAAQAGSGSKANAFWQGTRLMYAVVRNVSGTPYLWTCRHIGLNSVGEHSAIEPGDRYGIEWFQIQLAPQVQIVNTGRVYDSSATFTRSFYMPSLAINQRGDMLLGFSGSSANEYINCYYYARRFDGSASSGPIRYFSGNNPYYSNNPTFRWGDYSHTTLDPDGLKFWTIQQYAEVPYTISFDNAWGTRIGAITSF